MQQAIPADILNAKTNDINTNRPLISKGTYELKVESADIVAKKDDDTRFNLKLDLRTIKETTATTGEKLPPGEIVYHNIALTPTENMDWDMIKRNIAGPFQAAKVNTDLKKVLVDHNVTELKGKLLSAQVGVQDEKGGFPAKNVIQKFIVKK